MAPISPKTIETLSNKGYMLSINTVSLLKSMDKANFKTPASSKLITLASEISEIMLDLPDIEDNAIILRELLKVKELADIFFNTLQTFQTHGALAHEKADLHIDIYNFKNELAEAVSIFA